MSPCGTVLVVGATGLVGSHLAAELSGAGQRVLGTSTDGAGSDLACDLLRPETIETAIRQARPDTIVITAGQSSARRAWSDPTATFGLNTGGTASLLEAARRRAPEAHLVLASSGAAYGHAGNRAPDRGRGAVVVLPTLAHGHDA
ncbi:MAG: NAD-dependent epimerase/dehydratase family protein [Acidobacteriota bacterium]